MFGMLDFFVFLFFAVINGTFSLECYQCFGDKTFCNVNNTNTRSCPGQEYSCLLYFDQAKIGSSQVLGSYDFVETIRQGCAVEETDYCASRMKNDPGIFSCKAFWCYENQCNSVQIGAPINSNTVQPVKSDNILLVPNQEEDGISERFSSNHDQRTLPRWNLLCLAFPFVVIGNIR